MTTKSKIAAKAKERKQLKAFKRLIEARRDGGDSAVVKTLLTANREVRNVAFGQFLVGTAQQFKLTHAELGLYVRAKALDVDVRDLKRGATLFEVLEAAEVGRSISLMFEDVLEKAFAQGSISEEEYLDAKRSS